MTTHPVRLRTDNNWNCWGYSFHDNTWAWRPNITPLFSSTGIIPGLSDDDCQENYWVVETDTGERFAFQSIDIEDEVTA